MLILGITAIVMAIIGFILHGRHLRKIVTGEVLVFSWFLILLLAANDFANFAFALKSNAFEIFAVGGLIFLCNTAIVIIILLEGKKRGGTRNNWTTLTFGEKSIFILVVMAIFIITVIEILTKKGVTEIGNYPKIEYTFMWFAISVDLIALYALRQEVKTNPRDFEISSWGLFLFSGILASFFDLGTMHTDVKSPAFILMIENNLFFVLMLYFILKFKHKMI
jgi:hypothetical protein